MQQSRKRSPNFTREEREVFSELLTKYRDKIENRRTDYGSRLEKSLAWEQLSAEFNSVSQIYYRNEENLRLLWDNMKKMVRRKINGEADTLRMDGVNAMAHGNAAFLKVLNTSGSDIAVYDYDSGSESNTAYFYDQVDNAVYEEPDADEQRSPNRTVTEIAEIDRREFNAESVSLEDPVVSQSIKTEPGNITSAESVGQQAQQPNANEEKRYQVRRNIAPPTVKSNVPNTTRRSPSPDMPQRPDLSRYMYKRLRSSFQDNSLKMLHEAKIQLANITRIKMEEENNRQRELFEIEKAKALTELELLKLELLKKKRELGLFDKK